MTTMIVFKRIFKKITKHTCINFSLISQLKIPGLSFLYSSIFFSTSGVATRGLDPPITPGRIEPVSLIELKKKFSN